MIVQDVSRINEEPSDEEMCLDPERARYLEGVDKSQIDSVAKMMSQAKNPKIDPYLMRAAAIGELDELE